MVLYDDPYRMRTMSDRPNSHKRPTTNDKTHGETWSTTDSANRPTPFHDPTLERQLGLLAIRLLIANKKGDHRDRTSA